MLSSRAEREVCRAQGELQRSADTGRRGGNLLQCARCRPTRRPRALLGDFMLNLGAPAWRDPTVHRFGARDVLGRPGQLGCRPQMVLRPTHRPPASPTDTPNCRPKGVGIEARRQIDASPAAECGPARPRARLEAGLGGDAYTIAGAWGGQDASPVLRVVLLSSSEPQRRASLPQKPDGCGVPRRFGGRRLARAPDRRCVA